MVSAQRTGEPYAVEITDGRNILRADTEKDGVGGHTGMRPHELLESALAACIRMTIDIAAQRKGIAVPPCTVSVRLERLEQENRFHVAVSFEETPSEQCRDLVHRAVAGSPVSRTLAKPMRVLPAAIDPA